MNVIFLILYEWILFLIALISLPKFFYSLIFKKKYQKSFFSRLGFGFPSFKEKSIWIHAVSVGEVKAIVSLARELKQRYPNQPLIISTITETGHAEAKRSLPFAEAHIYLPFDFSVLIHHVLKKVNPSLVILSETDFWFNFLSLSKKRGATVVLVNGKLSKSSAKRFQWASFFSKNLFNLFDKLCVQNSSYRESFLLAGADDSKISVTGNLKLDDDYPQLSHEEVFQWRQKLGIKSNQIVITIGSTHYPEEQFFLNELKKLYVKFPEILLILVPRHPERFHEVSQLLNHERYNWINFSDINCRKGNEKVILMNAMGLLRLCYQLSDYTVVGGSFTERVGGHNILEPCWYGKPVIFGPYMFSQLEFMQLMIQYEAGIQVNPSQFSEILERWIENPEEARHIGANGLRLVAESRGSTKRTLDALQDVFSDCFCSKKS